MKSKFKNYISTLSERTVTFYNAESLRLDHGEVPYPPSPKVVAALQDFAAHCNRYPQDLSYDVIQRIAAYASVQPEQVIVGNGSDDLIELLVKAFVQPGEEVLIPVPSFFVYWRHATDVLGGKTVFFPRAENFDVDVEALVKRCQSSDVKIVFLANPNNPTGNLISPEKIEAIVQRLDCMVVVDECYYELCGATVLPLLDKYDNLILLRSFSKAFGIAGLRIGYALANADCINYLHRITQTFPVNILAQVGAIAALGDLDYMKSVIQKIKQQRTLLAEGLRELGFAIFPSETNFLFVETTPISSSYLATELKNRNVFISNFGHKPGLDKDAYLKISVGTAEENQRLLKELKAVLGH